MSFLQLDEQDLQNLHKLLIEGLGSQYQVEQNTVVEGCLPFIKETFDCVILKDGEPLAAIEYKSIAYSINLHTREEWLYDKFKKVGIQFGVLYFGRRDEFYLYKKGAFHFTKLSQSNLIAALKNENGIGEVPLVDDVAAGILGNMPDELSEIIETEALLKFKGLFTEDNLSHDSTNGEISFQESIEDEFFQLLLPQIKPSSLCQYTTLNSLFLTLRDKTHCMCSLTCMNDKGEISYADKYIHYGVYAYSRQIVEENNDCFILSCCDYSKMDDLTMWRLYGDQGKGVCLEYDYNDKAVDNVQFFLAPVSYGKEKDKHPQLDFIKNINNWEHEGWHFKLKRWHIWKHFFKSYLFKDEQECRLLFIPSENSKADVRWIMDSTNSIVSRIALFDVSDSTFPLSLRSVLVGPKCPEQESNVNQLNFMNSKQKVMPLRGLFAIVKASSIKDYR